MYLKVTSYDVREEKLKLWLFLLKVMNNYLNDSMENTETRNLFNKICSLLKQKAE